ncbi:phosphatidate phosphatase APP1 [Apiospora phragmitis]|uniref:Phosphatidate phosphatase APP1 n=1 Tax=Apiospora phragmitis TaxID=2905665 RepID=A0ABR1WRB5_9PEZI
MVSLFSVMSPDEMQKHTRKQRRFDDVEAELPNYAKASKASSPTLPAISYPILGSKNPLPRSVAADDTVWLLDNTAYKNPESGNWEAEFVSAVFAQHPSCTVLDAVSSVGKGIGLSDDDPSYPTIEERIMPFIQDIHPGTKVQALQAGTNSLKLGPGGRNGISSDVKPVQKSNDNPLVAPTFAQVPNGANGVLEMKTFFAEPEGWSVISGKLANRNASPPKSPRLTANALDIDDTIKVTMTSDPIGILKSTFTDTPQPCPGMPELYKYIVSLIKETSPFFYLSASPYNLYPFLRDFRQKYYPHGTIILRDSSWMSIPGLLSSITLGTEQYKVGRMDRIREWLPKRKFICIGDSTQADPESYGKIYRKYPGWVKLILIRKVTDIAALGIESKNEPKRFNRAFKGVPRERWHVFEDAAECRAIIQKMVAEES